MTPVPRSEGTPTAILEAMSCGIPVVATDVGGISEIVDHGKTGRVVPPFDTQGLASEVADLLQDANMRTQYGLEARRRAVERFDLSKCCEAHILAFESAEAGLGSQV